MRFMIIIKANADSEAGVIFGESPAIERFREMDQIGRQ